MDIILYVRSLYVGNGGILRFRHTEILPPPWLGHAENLPPSNSVHWDFAPLGHLISDHKLLASQVYISQIQAKFWKKSVDKVGFLRVLHSNFAPLNMLAFKFCPSPQSACTLIFAPLDS